MKKKIIYSYYKSILTTVHKKKITIFWVHELE